MGATVARDPLRREKLRFAPRPAGPLSLCLVYPNTYRVGMANLGFQFVYRLLAEDPRVSVERAFLPSGPRAEWPRTLRTVGSGRPAGDFDIVAFSVSFETDYVHVLDCLALAGIPLRREARGEGMPLVIAGGPATFLNPEPLADFVDVFLLGEAEEMLGEFVAAVAPARGNRAEMISHAGAVRGAYVPAWLEPRYDGGGRLCALVPLAPGADRVERRFVVGLDRFPAASAFVVPEAVFGGMVLVEASRGCGWGCRFCAAGYMYRPVRYRSPSALRERAIAGLADRRTIGLVGAEVASVPGVAALCEEVARAGGRVSPSSLKADVVGPRLAAALGAAGNRSVSVAPEAGSERLRRVINKNLSEDQILRAVKWLVGGGVETLKLYFMVGLPTETEADIEAIVELVRAIRARAMGAGRSGGRARIAVSINPFVPKPWTPFQWEPMAPVEDLRRKLAALRSALNRLGAVEVECESARAAYFQALLSRGDRRVGRVLEAIHAAGGRWWPVPAPPGVDPDALVHRAYAPGECLPWDFIDHGVEKRYLLAEWRKARAAIETPPCDVSTCRTCGACCGGA